MKKYKLLSNKYFGLQVGKIYKSTDCINDDAEQVQDFVTLYPEDWELVV